MRLKFSNLRWKRWVIALGVAATAVAWAATLYWTLVADGLLGTPW